MQGAGSGSRGRGLGKLLLIMQSTWFGQGMSQSLDEVAVASIASDWSPKKKQTNPNPNTNTARTWLGRRNAAASVCIPKR